VPPRGSTDKEDSPFRSDFACLVVDPERKPSSSVGCYWETPGTRATGQYLGRFRLRPRHMGVAPEVVLTRWQGHRLATSAVSSQRQKWGSNREENSLGAIGSVFRAELLRRWRSWVAVAVLISVVGGIALAGAAAGQRTDAAFPWFAAAYGFDAAVYAARPVPQLAKLSEVDSLTEVISPPAGQPTCDCTHPINSSDLTVAVLVPEGHPVWKLLSGHLPNPSARDQVLASFSLQDDAGVQVGTVIHVPFYAPSQFSAINEATGAPPRPMGPTLTLHVVGIETSLNEFPSGSTPSYALYATPAFRRTVVPHAAVSYEYFVRLRHGNADLPRFDADLHTLSSAGVEGYQSEDQLISSVERAVHPQAVGWWVLAALAALVGIAVIGQAVVRQSNTEREDFPTLKALGADRQQLIALGMARTLVVALLGAAGAVAIAFALSPLAPVGEARVAEPSAGLNFDAVILLLGVLIIVAVVLALGFWTARRATRTSQFDTRPAASHRFALGGNLATMGASPSALIGVRHALRRGSSGESVPATTALVGMVMAVTALCGTAIFGASLSHLTATPALYGSAFQLNFTDYAPVPNPVLLNSLEDDTAVTAITHGLVTEISINNVGLPAVAATAIRGQPVFTVVAGHFPSGDAQIGLGKTTMREVGAHLGSIVQVSVSSPSGVADARCHFGLWLKSLFLCSVGPLD
jgi:hypothetical protein